MSYTNARTPALLQGFAIPPNREPAHYALELAALVLAGGESSRLHQKHVRGDARAQSVSVWTTDQRGPDLFALRVVLSERATLAELERSVEAELARLGATGPTEEELARGKARVSSDVVFSLESNLHRATQLGEFELYWGDARLLSRELSRYQAVTAGEVRDAVKKYLTKARSSTVHVLPVGPAPAKSKPPETTR